LDDLARTIDVETVRGDKGEVTRARVRFGPHHFVEITRSPDGRVTFELGYTHHGFRVDASEVPSELERIIEEVTSRAPRRHGRLTA
jgi:hypothetical protein